MSKADEAAKHAMPVEAVCKMSVARAANDVALVPIGARRRIQPWPQPHAIKLGIGGRVGRAEELPEIRIVGKGTQARQLELEESEMRAIEVDRVNLCRLRHQIGERVTTARRDGDDGRAYG